MTPKEQKELIRNVADELGLQTSLVNEVFVSYWHAIYDKITSFQVFVDEEKTKFVGERFGVTVKNVGKFVIKAEERKIQNKNEAEED